MKLRPLIALLLVNVLLTPNAQALDLGDHLRIEGFGTLGAFQGDDPVATVRADPRQKLGSSGNDLRYDADSLLAIQATVNPMGPIKGVVQLVTKQDDQGSQKPKFEWAYLGWDINTSMNLKIGRVVAPVFMTSDMRNVAFAQTMARPMNTVYQLNPITNTDGANFKWQHRIGDNEFGLEGMIGQYDAKQVLGLGARYTHGPWTVRAGITDLKADVTLATSVAAKVDALKTSVACTNCASVLNERLVLSNAKARIQTLGVAFDDDTYVFQAEYATRPGTSRRRRCRRRTQRGRQPDENSNLGSLHGPQQRLPQWRCRAHHHDLQQPIQRRVSVEGIGQNRLTSTIRLGPTDFHRCRQRPTRTV